MQASELTKEIFVFGSNLAGIHGAGAARDAYEHHGAHWGRGYGLAGNSFAIPTKDRDIQTLPIGAVSRFVRNFLCWAKDQPDLTFHVTRIGCGLAGFQDSEIAPMFKDAPKNCKFSTAWKQWLPEHETWTDL